MEENLYTSYLTCPECQAEIHVPESGNAGLTTDYGLQRLAEKEGIFIELNNQKEQEQTVQRDENTEVGDDNVISYTEPIYINIVHNLSKEDNAGRSVTTDDTPTVEGSDSTKPIATLGHNVQRPRESTTWTPWDIPEEDYNTSGKLETSPVKETKSETSEGSVSNQDELHSANYSTRAEEQASSSNNNCRQHTEKQLMYYCFKCNEYICPRCVVPDHLQHDVKTIENASDECRQKIREQIETVTSKHERDWKTSLNQLNDIETKSQILWDDEYDEIDKSIADHTDPIREEGRRVLDQLKRDFQPFMTAVKWDKESLQRQIDSIKSTPGYSAKFSETMKNMSSVEIIKSQRSLLAKFNEACAVGATDTLAAARSPHLPTVHVEPPCHQVIAKIGRIVKPTTLSIYQTLEGFEHANAIASTPNGCLLIADRDSKKLLLYQKQNGLYQFYHCLHLQERPLGIAEVSSDEYLVSDSEGIKMYRTPATFLKILRKNDAAERPTIGPLLAAKGRLFLGYVENDIIDEHDASGGKFVRRIHTSFRPHRFDLVKNREIAVLKRGGLPGVQVIDMEHESTTSVKLTCHINVASPLCVYHDDNNDCLLVGQMIDKSSAQVQHQQGTGSIEQYCCQRANLLHRSRGICTRRA